MVTPRKIALLGASGSIGASTLEVIAEQSRHFQIVLAAAHSAHTKLCPLAIRFHIPTLVFTGISDPALQNRIKSDYPGIRFYFGEEDLLQLLANEDYDLALNAIGGSAGLSASHAILTRGKALALANKESLVMAGHLLRPMWIEHGIPVLPVDSEHSALFQAIGSHPAGEIRHLHITASGGAFRATALESFAGITPEMALRHPNWDMGAKVTLDSATMMNKALEVMEAHWLFGMPYEAISAVIHPQSVIHSLVEFVDGSFLAQLSDPDMRLPILYALSWPKRLNSQLVSSQPINWRELSFQPIEPERYPLYYLGLEAARRGGLYPTVLNSANEAALRLFLEQRISFPGIEKVVEYALAGCPDEAFPSLETVLATNRETYSRVLSTH